MGRYTKAQTDEFERIYKENRVKGTKNAKEILHAENVVARNIYQDMFDAYAKEQRKKQQQVPSLKPNPSIGDLKKYDYAANATPQISIGDLKRYDYAVNQKPNVSIGDLKQYDYAINPPKKQNKMSIGDLKKKDYDQAKAQKIGNPSDRGFPSSYEHKKIDFDKLIKNEIEAGFDYDKKIGFTRLNDDLDEYLSDKAYNKFIDDEFPIPSLKARTYVRDTDADYMKEFGLTKEEVLKQYSEFREQLEKQNREEHPFLSGLTDLKSAPDRAILGGLGVAAEWAFPGSDLSTMLNSDLAQRKNQTVQQHRDYTYDSDKLSQGKKTAAKIINEGGDMLVNSLVAQAVGNILSGVDAVNNASTAASLVESEAFANSPEIVELVNKGYNLADLQAAAKAYALANYQSTVPGVAKMAQAAAAYGGTATNRLHELEKQGVSHDKAVESAFVSGLLSAGSRYAMGELGGAATEGANWLTQALSRGGQYALLGAAGQSASELADMLILEDEATYKKDIQNYMLQGMSEKEAGQKAAQNLMARVGIAGLESGALGVGTSLAETGISSLLNPKVTPEDIYMDSDVVTDKVGGVPQAPAPTIPGGNAGYIPETTGLPALQGAWQMPGPTPAINLPTAVSGPVIELGDHQQIVIPRKADGITPNYMDLNEVNTRLEETKQNVAILTEQIEELEKQYNDIPSLKKNAREKYKLNKYIYGLEQQKKHDERLDKVFTKLAAGKKVNVKDIVELEYPEIYGDIYSGRGGLINDISLFQKFAGDTPEAKQLAQATRDNLYAFFNNGTDEDLLHAVDGVFELEKLARETNAEYKTAKNVYHYKDFFDYDDYVDYFGKYRLKNLYDINNISKQLAAAQQSVNNAVPSVPEVEAPVAPAVQAPAEAISAPIEAPVEVDPNNVIYHAGALGRLNKADTAGKMEPIRGTGYYGTGHYFVDTANRDLIGKGSGYADLPYSSVDISQYGNLFKADTDEKANKLHDFGKAFMHYIDKSRDRYDEDGVLDEMKLKETLIDLYEQYCDLFRGGNLKYDYEQFKEILNQYRKEYDWDFYDRGDTAFTSFMKDHGFNGVDTRGTRSAGTDRGIVIYDLDEDSVLQSNVTDPEVKAGLMNTKVRNGAPVFDEEVDNRVRESVEGSNKRKEIRKEYVNLYDETPYKEAQKKRDELNERVSALQERKEYYDAILKDEANMEQAVEAELREFRRLGLDDLELTPEMARETLLFDAEEFNRDYKERLWERKTELNKLDIFLAAEEEKQKAAYEQARQIVEARHAIPEVDLEAAAAEEVANELPQLEEDVINEDIVPDIENQVANTRDYTPDEIAEITALSEQRDAINAQVEEAAGHLMTTKPEDLKNLFAQLDAINNELYSKYPELFEGKKFTGVPSVDNNGNPGYNVGTGGNANEVQVSEGYDGRGSNAVVEGVRESESPDQGIDRTLQEGGVLLPDDRGAITEQLRNNPAVISPSESSELAYNGISNQPFYDANTNADLFTQALATAKANNPNGESVDGHDLNEIQSIIDNGGSVFLTEDATSGGAVEADGNLTCVFKDSTSNKTPEMGTAIALAAIKKGATKGDCFGRFLVNTYSLAGFEPVARVKYAYKINPGMDAYVDKMIAEGKFAGPPDVYAFKLRDGYDYETAVAAHNDPTKAIAYTQEQLDELPLYEGENSYFDMLDYRDSLLEKQPEGTASSNESQSYFLRLLGDEEFLRNEALKYAYTQQQNGAVPGMIEDTMNEMRAYAARALGYEVPQPTQSVPNMQPGGPTTPPPEVPHMDVDSSDTQKTSEYYHSTMRNTEANKDLSDKQYAQYFDESGFQYTASTQNKSVLDAKSLITKLGGVDKAIESLLDPAFFDNNEFNHIYLDAAEMLADAAEKRAMTLKNSGLDYSEAMRVTNRLHRLVQKNLSNSAQIMQATKKWKVPSPRAQIDTLIGQINAAIDKGKTSGYCDMINDLADAIEDAVVKGGSKEDILKRIHKIFEDNRSNSQYDTKKAEALVERYIRNAEKNPDMAEAVARLVKKEMGVSTMTYQQEIEIAELLEQAFQFDPKSRSFQVLAGRAMKKFDETLPPDKISTKFRSIIYDNMLASIRTMLTRNLGGNAVVKALDTLERPVMVGADAITGLFTKQRTRVLSGKAIVEGFKGFGHGAKDWALDIKDKVNTGRSGQMSMEDLLAQNHNTFKARTFNSNNAIAKGANAVIKGANVAGHFYDRLVRKGMEFGDRTIYEMTYFQTKAELYDVVDKYGDEGLRRGLGLKNNVSTDDLIEYIATGEALESVFQNDSQLKKGAQALKKAFRESSEGILGIDVASLTMTPFIEVPSNMMDVMLQHTPVGVLSNIRRTINEKRKYGHFNQRRFTKEAGRNISSIALTAAGMGAAAAGLISGPLSEDKDEKAMQQNNGYQEYALQTPDGKTQVDVSDIPVIGPYMQYSKRLYDAFNEGGMKGVAEEYVPALGAVSADQLYQSLNRLTGSTGRYSSDKGGLLSNMGDAIATSAASIGIPSVVRQTAQYMDDFKRDLGDYGTTEYIKNLFLNGIPSVREKTLNPKINTSGDYVPELNGKEGAQRFASAYLTPWKVTNPEKGLSAGQKYISKIKEETGGKVNPQMPVFNKKDVLNIKGYDKENYTHDDLAELRENFYKTNDATSDRLIFEPWFRQLPYEQQGTYLDMLFAANKDNAKEDLVRKGLTEKEIEALGDTIFTTNDPLAKILRTDDNAHSGMIQYFKDLVTLDEINKKYGTNISYNDYKEREAKRKGGTEIFAQEKAAANRYGIDLDTYRKYADYPGGVEKGLQDEQEAQWYGLSLENYNKFADKAGENFEQAKDDYAQLRRLGFNNYNVALDYARSTDLTIPEFAELFRQMDVDNQNQVLSQKEVKDYLNAHPEIGDEQAQQIWAIGGFKSEDGKQDTLLYRNSKGKWTSGYPKK